ncbi:Hypothetical predicted protein [Cloeon dipterum]|nr:Hypothetical predicted protein [Cloeon dipterum]
MVLDKLLKTTYWSDSLSISFKNSWLAFPSLLSRETKSIETNTLENIFNLHVKTTSSTGAEFPILKVLQLLAEKAPNLQELIVNHSGLNSRLCRDEIASFSNLNNLAELRILRAIVLHSELKEIVENCKGLQVIEVWNLRLEGEQKIDFLNDGFLFHKIEFGSGDSISVTLDKDLSRPDNEPHDLLGPGPHYYLVGRPESVADLKFLETQPHATKLEIYCKDFKDEPKVSRFPHLPKLRCATFRCWKHKTHALECCLEENGRQLSRLAISPVNTSRSRIAAGLPLAKIFGWCSNLEWFSLENFSMPSYNVPISFISHLKYFRWFNKHDTRVDVSSVLTAPQLEDFEIGIYKLDLGDKKALFSRIAQKEILKNLKRFTVILLFKMDATNLLLQDELAAEIKSAFPDVHEFKFRALSKNLYVT